jgi:hypothetical protein
MVNPRACEFRRRAAAVENNVAVSAAAWFPVSERYTAIELKKREIVKKRLNLWSESD